MLVFWVVKTSFHMRCVGSVKSPVQGQGKTTSPVMVTPNNENGDRRIVIEFFHAQKNTVVSIEVQNNIELLVEAQHKIDLPIVVEPVEAQNKLICHCGGAHCGGAC